MRKKTDAIGGSTAATPMRSWRGVPGAVATILAVVALAVFALALTAVSASADAPPVVTINAPSEVAYTTAHVSGTVNPEGGPSPVNWHFEYSTEPENEFAWNFALMANGEIAGAEAEGTTPIAVEGNLESVEEIPGLAPGTEYSVRLVAENGFGANRAVTTAPYPTLKTKPVAVPAVSIATPSAVTGSSAHFSGEVNPGAPAGNPAAFDVNWRFECTPECPGLSGGTIPADNSNHTLEVDAAGLLYNTEYEVKLIVSNAGGETSASQTFKTEAVGPEVESRTVGSISATTAIIGGSVDPNGSPTIYWIEYANNEAFTGATSLPATRDASAGSGQTPVVVSRLISGLQPESTYYFRINAKNGVSSVVSAPQTFHTRAVEAGATTCANETLRAESNSLALPDCRAYELVSPDLNHALLGVEYGGITTPDGNTMVYATADAPQHANSGQPLENPVRATRNPVHGWSGISLAPPVTVPLKGYFSFIGTSISSDLSSTYAETDQPLIAGPVPSGKNGYIGHSDGTYTLITNAASGSFGSFGAGNADFSHVYFYPAVPQLPSDPAGGGNLYSWSEEQGLNLVGILPNGTAAPSGVRLVGNIIGPISTDANRAVFTTEGKLYLHVENAPSVEVSASQRTSEPDPNPGPGLAEIAPNNPQLLAGITKDGSMVLFVAHSELTNDANTGSSAGVATDAGTDLYSYDVASGDLTDLTVDTNPADAATGADVRQVLGSTADGSYIYFTATGDLAPGAVSGHTSLYVWHEGHIAFVTDAGKFLVLGGYGGVPRFYVTPDGQHTVFASTDSLTGYDNIDPVTGQPHSEVFESTLGAGIQCASCRTDGSPPTADSFMPFGGLGAVRTSSDDGSRVFFQSTDAILPRASNGLQKVYEYSNGTVSLLSPADGTSNAEILAASASGNDVFIGTYDELVPNPNGGDSAVYDARVGGGFPVNSRKECSGVACRGPLSSAPVFGAPSSISLSGAGNLAPPGPAAKAGSKPPTRAQRLAKALKACKSKHNKKKRSTCEKRARRTYGRSK